MQFETSPESLAGYLEGSARENQLSYLLRSDGWLAGFVNANNIVRGAFKSRFLGYGVFQRFERQGAIATGYALFEEDGLWREHTWGRYKDGTLVETTIPFEAYFGYEMTSQECDRFASHTLPVLEQ